MQDALGGCDWTDYQISAQMKIHLADRAGLIARWQGQERFIALVRAGSRLKLIERLYGETVLDEAELTTWKGYDVKPVCLQVKRGTIRGYVDCKQLVEGKTDQLDSGAAGFLVDTGIAGYCDIAITATRWPVPRTDR